MRRQLSEVVCRDVPQDRMITGITADSRKVADGYLFAALPGVSVDGRKFAPEAVKAGAAAVLAQEDMPDLGVPVIVAEDPRRAFALAAARFWEHQPATTVAVTGTNGKTSVAAFCRQIFNAAGHRAASMLSLIHI